MKKYLIVIIVFTLTSCQTNVKISQTRIRKNSKFVGSFVIDKIKVDSFSANGVPKIFHTDSVFYCIANTEVDNDTDSFPVRRNKLRYRKKIKFLKPNKYYDWYTWKYNDRNSKYRINQIHFTPLCWYYFSIDWSYGLLTSGQRSHYFYFGKKGKLILLFEDYENNGPF
jgi:hypothetical protein